MPSRILCNGVCSGKTLKLGQTWLLGFSAMYHYTKFGMASENEPNYTKCPSQRDVLLYQQHLLS